MGIERAKARHSVSLRGRGSKKILFIGHSWSEVESEHTSEWTSVLGVILKKRVGSFFGGREHQEGVYESRMLAGADLFATSFSLILSSNQSHFFSTFFDAPGGDRK